MLGIILRFVLFITELSLFIYPLVESGETQSKSGCSPLLIAYKYHVLPADEPRLSVGLRPFRSPAPSTFGGENLQFGFQALLIMGRYRPSTRHPVFPRLLTRLSVWPYVRFNCTGRFHSAIILLAGLFLLPPFHTVLDYICAL